MNEIDLSLYLVTDNSDNVEKFLNTIVPFVVYGFSINNHMPLYLGLQQHIIPKVNSKTLPKIIVKKRSII